jgi:hypothetical protein
VTWRQRLVIRPDEFDIADAVDFIVVGHAGGASAESDLGPKIKVHFAAAFIGGTSKGHSGAPLVERKRPFLFGPQHIFRLALGGLLREAFDRGKQQGQSQAKTKNYSARVVHRAFT